MAILPNLNNVTDAALKLRIAELEAQLAAKKNITMKVGQSGALCVYHGARYPVTLYRSQWEHLLPFLKSGQIEAFIQANAHLLATKD